MTVSNHHRRSIFVQSSLLQNASHFGSCLEPLSIIDEVCPLKPSSTRDSSSAFVAFSSLLACELSFAAHVQDWADLSERISSAVASTLDMGLIRKILASGS